MTISNIYFVSLMKTVTDHCKTTMFHLWGVSHLLSVNEILLIRALLN